MTSSVFDSSYFCDSFGDPNVQKIFSDNGRYDSWLRVEVALAKSQAKHGIIPKLAADKISRIAKVSNLDTKKMTDEYLKIGFPILPLVNELIRNTDSETARWIHWGATTQDIVDTGLVLQMKESFEFIESYLDKIISLIQDLTLEHKDTILAGRTFQQHAAPITLGFKMAVWLDELLRHKNRLPQIKKNGLVCQLGGAVGTLATLKDKGIEVLETLSDELNLEIPSISWHTSRDGWAEIIFWISLLASTLAKIANEVSILMRTEIGEIKEAHSKGKGGSSTMPQKRNPVECPIIISIGHRLQGSTMNQLNAMIQEHERGVSAMPLEWMTIPEAFILISGSLKRSIALLEGLQIDKKAMLKNLNLGGGNLMSEAVMMGLANKIGKKKAHNLINDIADHSQRKNISLEQALLESDKMLEYFDAGEIKELLNPLNYVGSSESMIKRVLSKLHD